MDKNQTDPSPFNEINIIPLLQAQRETARWRDLFAKVFHHKSSEALTRAFFIPLNDLEALVNRYKDLKPAPTGARAYIGHVDSKEPGSYNLRLLLVPATLCHDYCEAGPGLPGSDDPGSSVYDFTMPCPTSCDPKSKLNIDPDKA